MKTKGFSELFKIFKFKISKILNGFKFKVSDFKKLDSFELRERYNRLGIRFLDVQQQCVKLKLKEYSGNINRAELNRLHILEIENEERWNQMEKLKKEYKNG